MEDVSAVGSAAGAGAAVGQQFSVAMLKDKGNSDEALGRALVAGIKESPSPALTGKGGIVDTVG